MVRFRHKKIFVAIVVLSVFDFGISVFHASPSSRLPFVFLVSNSLFAGVVCLGVVCLGVVSVFVGPAFHRASLISCLISCLIYDGFLCVLFPAKGSWYRCFSTVFFDVLVGCLFGSSRFCSRSTLCLLSVCSLSILCLFPGCRCVDGCELGLHLNFWTFFL